MHRTLPWLINAFPFWVAGGGLLALFQPSLFTWFSGPWIIWGLAFIMLGMGITLQVSDFMALRHMPRAVVCGFTGQFTLMPFIAWAIAQLFQLPNDLAAGVILVACCPGGTASNVVTFLARGNVALSVAMTICSTLAAVFLTPLLTLAYAGTRVPVDAAGLVMTTFQVVIIPIALGVALNRWLPRLTRQMAPASPLLSVILVMMICSSIIGQQSDVIRQSGFALLGSVACLHLFGFAAGYGFAKIFRLPPIACRTVSIEVGMQNSGLGVILARQHFAAFPLVAVPCAISSVFHSVIGSILAGYWRWKSPTR
jgi:BASS family bile acid:Na+ symporter